MWDITTDASSWHVLGNAKVCHSKLVVAQPGRATDCRGYQTSDGCWFKSSRRDTTRTCGRVVKGAGLKIPSRKCSQVRTLPCAKQRIQRQFIGFLQQPTNLKMESIGFFGASQMVVDRCRCILISQQRLQFHRLPY